MSRSSRPLRLDAVDPDCPTPGKFSYPTRALAKRRLRRHGNKQAHTVYPCGDHWHVGRRLRKGDTCDCGHRHLRGRGPCRHCGCDQGLNPRKARKKG